jgi:hypothetical protein
MFQELIIMQVAVAVVLGHLQLVLAALVVAVMVQPVLLLQD